MRVLVCGGRDYTNWTELILTLDSINITHLIAGGASGADSMAVSWATNKAIPHTIYPAPWMRSGRAAGAIRNQRMLDDGKPELVVAFPGGAGTADMVARAKHAGVKVVREGRRF